MRLIDADALDRHIYEDIPLKHFGSVERMAFVRALIDAAPAISPDEVRGVVRCGECIHADKDVPGAIYCAMWNACELPKNGFCFEGKKMELSEDGD